jgi:hypothetical protein
MPFPITDRDKSLYLVATTRRKNRQDLIGSTHVWKEILNALSIRYGDRVSPSTAKTTKSTATAIYTENLTDPERRSTGCGS